MIITITNTEKIDGDYGEYVKVTGMDGTGKETTKNVSSKFLDRWPLLKNGSSLEFKMVQKDGKWIIAGINPIETPEPVTPPTGELNEPTQEQVKKDYKETTDKMSKDDWADKDKRTRKSIERQTCLNDSTKLAEADKIEVKDIISYAVRFEKYLDTGE